jgi:hypothetical protein
MIIATRLIVALSMAPPGVARGMISHASVALLASLAWGDRKYCYFVI